MITLGQGLRKLQLERSSPSASPPHDLEEIDAHVGEEDRQERPYDQSLGYKSFVALFHVTVSLIMMAVDLMVVFWEIRLCTAE